MMALSAAQMVAMSRLLDEALPLDAAGRERWLANLPPEHAELAAALRDALIPAAGDASAGLNTLPRIGAASAPNATLTGGLHPGERVGPYELVRRLGTGGMAEVWLAHRADGTLKREVALKLPTLWRLRADLAQRFARERDILAGLEHIHIARLYDAGVSGDGLPYLALEYVEGKPLTAWCDEHRLGLRERLKLVLQVLDAVQYAHGHHVIHRDLKPSNILVTEAGQVRLLDFGIAKLLLEGETTEETQLTQMYGRAFTADYASPEQLRGESLTTASDLYSLGVVLYELLAGNRPYQLRGDTAALPVQAIVGAEIAKPSTKAADEAAATRSTTPAKLVRRLKGDLDAIALRALAKAPTDRYPSAEALADDLQRYLSGEPVEAQPDRLTYRAGKYVLRHRTSTAMAALAAGAIAMVLVLALIRPPSTAPAETKSGAAEISDKSIAVLPFVDMSAGRDQEYFTDGLSEELIDRLAKTPGLKVIARTSAFSFKGKSDDVPTIARKLRVANVLEGSVRKSGDRLRITAQLVRADNGYHLWSESYDRKVDDIFKVQDEIAAAVVLALKASLLPEAMPKARGTVNIEAYTLYLQARSMFLRADGAEDWNRIGDYLQRAITLDPSFAPSWAWLSRVRAEQAANGYVPSGPAWDDARHAAAQALVLDPKLSEAHIAMAKIQMWQDYDWTGAGAQIERALKLDPGSWSALAWAGHLARALGQTDKEVELFQRVVANDPLNGLGYSNLGRALYRSGRFSEAQVAIRQSLDFGRLSGHWDLGKILLVTGDPIASLAEFERCADEDDRLAGRALTYHVMGRTAEADAALAALEKRYAEEVTESESTAIGASFIAMLHAFRGESDQAFAWLDRSYRRRETELVWGGLKSEPLLNSLRPDPRYRAFLRKMNLPE
jgi:TolB-like protein